MTIGITGPERKAPRQSAVVKLIIAAVVVGILLILLGLASDFLVDWLWFSSIGYLQVFWTTIGAKAAVFFAIWTATAVILWLNGWLALRFARRPPTQSVTDFVLKAAGNVPPPDLLTFMRDRLPWPRVIAGAACLVALLVAAIDAGNWNVFLQFLYRVPFGADDPLYSKDIGFYLFVLPAYIIIKNWMLLTGVLSALSAGMIYWVHGDIQYDIHHRSMSPTAIAHLRPRPVSAALRRQWRGRRRELHGRPCQVAHVVVDDRPVDRRGVRCLGKRLDTHLSASRRGGVARRHRHFGAVRRNSRVVPAAVRQTERAAALEKPYIERNIALTRQAYNLHQIAAKPFAAEQNLTLKTLEANKATIENIRLWDWTPLSDTYAQLQEIRTYYKFHDLDVDRYWLDGSYQSVMLSARELRPSLLPPNAQTWVNQHVLFTHGNGAVMSPVTRKSVEGLPVLYLRDIPPVADGGPPIREPRIYYGEERDNYVIVKGSTPEFDYPKGKDNAYAAYDGTGGIPIGATVWRGLFAYYFNDPNLILSSYITADSRIMIRRNIRERIRTIAPFLRLDHDPYLVISDGRMFWMQDAYTTSSYFPSAQPAQDLDLNYIRNSVKIVVDAYHGTVDFYLMDTSDPVALTYQRIFPSLFKPFSAMPADLQKHIRYPEDLFLIQARLYQTYRRFL